MFWAAAVNPGTLFRCRFFNSMRVCVCFRFIYFGGSPSDQGETCNTLCSVSRGLNLFSAFFCPTRIDRGHTGWGKHREGLSPSFYILSCPTFLLLCLPTFYLEKGPAVPFLVDHELEVCFLTKLFSILSLSTPRHESEKNPLSPRFEPVTWVPEGYEDTN